ncbi:hypothetical protein FWH13_01800 [Candidatus Saccharibacteria bacterium]|nr:hypothetical protein [Candidatus Saccharibacteria bacterium]
MHELGKQWLALMKDVDFQRETYGPGTDREASSQRQADAIGPEANPARVQYYEEKAEKVRNDRGPGTDSEDAYLKLATKYRTA